MRETNKPTNKSTLFGYGLMAGSLVALLLGLVVGIYLNSAGAGAEAWKPLRSFVSGVGTGWVNAIRVLALPLAVANLMSALLKESNARAAGRIGAASLALFCTFLLLAFGLSLVVVPQILRGLPVDRDMVAAFSRTASEHTQKLSGNQAVEPAFGDFLTNLVPRNVVKSALQEDILPLLVFAVGFAMALRRARPENGEVVIRFIHGTAEALFVMVRWIIFCTPVGVFAIALNCTADAGIKVAGILGQFMLVECGLMLVFLAMLYFITAAGSGMPVGRFARAAWPAQIVAMTTRSSLASLPALLECAEDGLRLNPTVARMVLPLAVSVYRANRPLSAITRLFFVAHFWSVPLSPGRIAAFTATIFLVSFSDLGIPGGTRFQSVPAYLAAGLPIEGVILLEVLEPVADIIKTLLNVTADLSVAVVADRILSRRPARVSETAAVPELVG